MLAIHSIQLQKEVKSTPKQVKSTPKQISCKKVCSPEEGCCEKMFEIQNGRQ